MHQDVKRIENLKGEKIHRERFADTCANDSIDESCDSKIQFALDFQCVAIDSCAKTQTMTAIVRNSSVRPRMGVWQREKSDDHVNKESES